MSARQGILFAAPGTTCREAKIGYDQIGRAAALRFPGVEQRWTCTSAGIRRKLVAQGTPVQDPAEALSAMQAEGFTRVAVLSLHLTDGLEFGELAAAVSSQRQSENPMRVELGYALMTCEADWCRALHALWASLSSKLGDQDQVILVAHGSLEPQARKTLLAAAQLCRRVDRRLTVGMMLGAPGLEDVVRDCRSAGVQKAWVLPCMVVAGFSARENIAGSGEGSWATVLAHAGIEVVPVIQGLGEVSGVVDIWMDQIERLLAELMKSNGPQGLK